MDVLSWAEEEADETSSLSSLFEFRVRRVDGTEIRNNTELDFIGAGNGERWPFIPPDEIWVEMALPDADLFPFLVHEVVETRHMRDGGMAYEEAHDLANKAEIAARAPGHVSAGDAIEEAERFLEQWFGVGKAVYRSELLNINPDSE